MAQLREQPKEKTMFLNTVIYNTYECTLARFQLNLPGFRLNSNNRTVNFHWHKQLINSDGLEKTNWIGNRLSKNDKKLLYLH